MVMLGCQVLFKMQCHRHAASASGGLVNSNTAVHTNITFQTIMFISLKVCNLSIRKSESHCSINNLNITHNKAGGRNA